MADGARHEDAQALLGELRQAATRISLLPTPVPADDPRREGWTEAVYVRGEAPFGRCCYCNVARSPAGCLNLCEMPSGFSRRFTQGILDQISKRRGAIVWLEKLGGCTCGPASLFGYQVERESHDYGCPMRAEPTDA